MKSSSFSLFVLEAIALSLMLTREASAQPAPVTLPLAGEPTPPAPSSTLLPEGWKASLVGAAQMRVLSDIEEGKEDAKDPHIELRRLRVGVRLHDREEKTTVLIMTNLTPTAPELIDAYVERKFGKAQLRVGQMKIPFTGYRQGSFTDLLTSDWPLVTRVFGAGRQLGLQVAASPSKEGGWYGAAGVFQGTTLRTAHDQGTTALYGETAVSYTDFRKAPALDSIHPELALRLGHRWALGARGDHLDLELSARRDMAPVEARDLRDVGAIEGNLQMGRLSLLGIGYGGQAEQTQKGEVAPILGFFAQVGVRLPHGLTPSLGVAQVAWSTELQDDALTRAARLIAGAAEKDRAAVQKAHGADGKLAGERAVTLALRWDAASRVAFWAEGARIDEVRVGEDTHAIRLRLQGQITY